MTVDGEQEKKNVIIKIEEHLKARRAYWELIKLN